MLEFIKPVEKTEVNGQRGCVVGLSLGEQKSSLAMFCDAIELDDIRIKVLHGDNEEELLSVTVTRNNFIVPTVQFSSDDKYCYVKFDEFELHVCITDEGIVIDLWKAGDDEESVESSYLFEDEVFTG